MPNHGSSLAAVRPSSVNGDPLPRSAPQPVLKAVTSPTRNAAPSPPTSVGFLLLDSAFQPISFNAEAIRILGYPDQFANVRRPHVLLAERIHLHLLRQGPPGESPLVTEFRSGRRRYLCRAFPLHLRGRELPHASIAVLLERSHAALIPLSDASQQFRLTRREREAIAYLLEGLSSKEIANRMTVSANTVKAVLRLIMVKMGVSSRLEIVAKIIAARP